MAIDVPTFLRLRSSIRATLERFDSGNAVAQGTAAPEAYVSLREEARRLVPEDELEEFERLFPVWTKGNITRVGTFALPLAEEAKALLARLQGWLEGFIEAAEWEQKRR